MPVVGVCLYETKLTHSVALAFFDFVAGDLGKVLNLERSLGEWVEEAWQRSALGLCATYSY